MSQVIFQERLHQLFEYRDGHLYWKKLSSPLSRAKIGEKAGTWATHGYWRIKFDGVTYMAHKLIYAMHNGGTYPDYIDHIDGNKSNNKLDNLRPATNIQNAQNVGLHKNSTTGIKNVSWSPSKNRWKVLISANGKRKSWLVKDLELAELVAIEARNKYHGSYANHGL
jgi:hypothetical protein